MNRPAWITWAGIFIATVLFVCAASFAMRERCVAHKENRSAFGSDAFGRAHFHGCSHVKSWYEY